MDLIPRYPLFGGWKASFYMGYNLPIQSYLFTDASDSSLYVLNITFANTLDDVVIENLIVRIILPEGAKNIKFYTPFNVDSEASSTHWTYLDTTGRPVLILSKRNVVSEHDKYFQVTYNFSQLSMLHEPLLLIIAFFTFFVCIIAYVRINFSIGPVKQRSPNADRLEDLLSRVKDIIDQRADIHSHLENSLENALKTKNTVNYNADKKKIETTLNNFKKEIQKIAIEIEDLDSDIARKVREIERKEEKKSFNQNQLHEHDIAVRIEKKSPKVLEESKVELQKFNNNVDEEIDAIVTELTESI